MTPGPLINAAKLSSRSVTIELEPNAPTRALETVMTALKDASVKDVSVVTALPASPFFLASRDLGYRIVSQEVGRTMGIGRGHHVPAAADWEMFTQLELLLDKDGEIVSVRRIYGSEMPDFSDRLLGAKMQNFAGSDRIVARLYLKKQPVP
jgi:hypothetical protein